MNTPNNNMINIIFEFTNISNFSNKSNIPYKNEYIPRIGELVTIPNHGTYKVTSINNVIDETDGIMYAYVSLSEIE